MATFKLTPAIKSYIWGGKKLKTKYGKSSSNDIIAETWELSLHKDGLSHIENSATSLYDLFFNNRALFGKNLENFSQFPVMVKLIDAMNNLSIQVHPSDNYALTKENGSLGKTEMWYIVDNEENAGIYLGLKETINQETLEKAIFENTLTNYLNFIPVKKGEYYFIPSGTIHAIAKGCLICEIQQNSNLTYRIYDYGRLGADNKPRELHIEKAKAVADLHKFNPKTVSFWETPFREKIGFSKYFTTSLLNITGEIKLPRDAASFKSITVIEGSGKINNQIANIGETFFLSALEETILEGHFQAIEVEIRKYFVDFIIEKENRILSLALLDDRNIVFNTKSISLNNIKEKSINFLQKEITDLLSPFCLTIADCQIRDIDTIFRLYD